MKFEIQGNNVTFRTDGPVFLKSEDFLRMWLPVEVFGKTFYIDRKGLDRLEKIIIKDEV